MAELSQNRGKRRDGEVLGGAVDFLLANARLVLGVGGAAVLGIATLAVKRVRLAWPEDPGAPQAGPGVVGLPEAAAGSTPAAWFALPLALLWPPRL